MSEGLHQTIVRKRAAVAWLESQLGKGALEPRDEHMLRTDVNAHELELVELTAAVVKGEALHEKLAAAVEGLRELQPKTRELALALNAAEIGLFRLRGHLGTKPEVPS